MVGINSDFSRHKQTIYLHNNSENITVHKSNSNEVSHNFLLLKEASSSAQTMRFQQEIYHKKYPV